MFFATFIIKGNRKPAKAYKRPFCVITFTVSQKEYQKKALHEHAYCTPGDTHNKEVTNLRSPNLPQAKL